MEGRFEEFLEQDEYLQAKIKELNELKGQVYQKHSAFYTIFSGLSTEKSLNKPLVVKDKNTEQVLGKENLVILQKVFLKFSGFKDYFNVQKLDHSMFSKFLEESGILSEGFSKVSADLAFFRNRKSNFTDFSGFLEILARISKILFPVHSKYEGLCSLIRERILPNLGISKEIEKYQQLHQLFIDQNIQDLLSSRKPTLAIIFNLFRSQNSAELDHVPAVLRTQKQGKKYSKIERITLKGFLSFLSAFEIVPNLLSGLAAAQIFRSVPCQIAFSESLTYSEFTEAAFFLSILIYSPATQSPQNTLQHLESLFKYLDAHPKFLIQHPNPLRNTVYTLTKNIDFS